jgi:DNA-binding XRE family transcriptional regulator
MKKISDLKTGAELHAADMANDPEYRAEWERTRFAHEVALRVLAYRVEHNLTQTALARLLGMRQPHIARLEASEHEPSLATLARLARVLDMEFHIDITQSALLLTAWAREPVAAGAFRAVPGAVGIVGGLGSRVDGPGTPGSGGAGGSAPNRAYIAAEARRTSESC